MGPRDPLVNPGLALTLPLVATPVAVAEGRGHDLAYDLGYRAGQIAADVLIAAIVLGAVLGGAALIRRLARRRRTDGRPG